MDKTLMVQKAREMVAGVDELPTIPVVAMKVLELLEKPDVELDEVVDLILTDQILAARVIKIVNSPLYRAAQEITSVKQALIYLGFRHVRELALTCSFIESFKDKGGAFDVQTFWEHSFGVGIVSKLIAQRARYNDIEKAYLVGIIHDIGEVFLSYYHQDDFMKIVESKRGEPRKFYTLEAEFFGTTHCEIGLCIAEKWNFPKEYKEIISLHHTPLEATIDPPLNAIVNLADLFCTVRQLDYGGREWISFNLAEEAAWEILKNYAPHLGDLDVERFCYELDDQVEEIQELVRSIFAGISEE